MPACQKPRIMHLVSVCPWLVVWRLQPPVHGVYMPVTCSTLVRTIDIIKRYCFCEKPVRFQILSEQSAFVSG